MEGIKVNDYVRLARNQGIRKIVEIEDDCYCLDEEIADEWGETAYSIRKEDLGEEVLKHSENIIDLIEVGDYVNGDYVVKVYTYKNGKVQFIDVGELQQELRNKDIKSVVTKEQFNSIKYEV